MQILSVLEFDERLVCSVACVVSELVGGTTAILFPTFDFEPRCLGVQGVGVSSKRETTAGIQRNSGQQ